LLTALLLRFGPTIGLAATIVLLALLLAAYGAAWSRFHGGADGSADADRVRPVCAQHRLRVFAATRSKRQITKLFGQYVPPELAAEMSRNPAHYTMEGQSRDMTVLFSDIRGFTIFPRNCSRPSSPKC